MEDVSRNEDYLYVLFPKAKEAVAKRGMPHTIWVSPNLFVLFSPFLRLLDLPIKRNNWLENNWYILDWSDSKIKKSNGLEIDAIYVDEARYLK